jgi:hypothetical protein
MTRPWIIPVVLMGFLITLCVVLSCKRAQVTTEKAEQVAASSLVKFFRDFPPESADSIWKGRKLLVNLAAKGYKVSGNEIHFFTGFPNAPPVLIFKCGSVPEDNSKAVDITGRCRGFVKDGKNRGTNVDFYVVIDECSMVVR